MLLLNFTHPLTPEQLDRVAELAGRPVERVVDILPQFDHDRPFAEQVAVLVDAVGLTPQEWQTRSIILNPPALSWIAAVLLAELHGRMGYFPPIVRLRPVPGSLPPRYEVVEIINLQQVRDAARGKR